MQISSLKYPRGDVSEPVNIRLARDPLAFLAEEHLRQRRVCAHLDALAMTDAGDPALAAEALSHLEREMPIHMMDEEDDLFPLLRRRAEPDDEIEPTLSRLDRDHAKGRLLTGEALPCLSRMAAGGAGATPDERSALMRLAAHERRHLIVENAIILPLARVRLTESDLRTLALRMAARRGVNLGASAQGSAGAPPHA